jgi:hypothetical protein
VNCTVAVTRRRRKETKKRQKKRRIRNAGERKVDSPYFVEFEGANKTNGGHQLAIFFLHSFLYKEQKQRYDHTSSKSTRRRS